MPKISGIFLLRCPTLVNLVNPTVYDLFEALEERAPGWNGFDSEIYREIVDPSVDLAVAEANLCP